MHLGTVVIGSNIESALYAFVKGYCFFPTSEGPIFYETLPFRLFGSKRKDFAWFRILVMMGLDSKLLNYEQSQGVQVSENELTIVTRNRKYRHTFDKCVVFDPTDIDLESEIIKVSPETYTVLDDFELSNLGGKHPSLEQRDNKVENFTKKINYYISDRVPGANYITDCVTESVLTKENLYDFQYSDSMARFAVMRHLREIGIEGNFMGYYKNGLPKYRKPKVTHRKRIIRKKDNNTYKDSKNVVFLRRSIQEIVDEFSFPAKGT